MMTKLILIDDFLTTYNLIMVTEFDNLSYNMNKLSPNLIKTFRMNFKCYLRPKKT